MPLLVAQHFFIHFCGKPLDGSSKPLRMLKEEWQVNRASEEEGIFCSWQVNRSSEEEGILCLAGWMRKSFGALWVSAYKKYCFGSCRRCHDLHFQLGWPCSPSACMAAGSVGAEVASVVVLLMCCAGPELLAPVPYLPGATPMASASKHTLDTWSSFTV